jgi:hypothetical protein
MTASSFELQIGAFRDDDAHPDLDRKCAYRRQFVPRQPVADGNPVPDLLHQLQVHRAPVGLGHSQQTLQEVSRAH